LSRVSLPKFVAGVIHRRLALKSSTVRRKPSSKLTDGS
jgi:hypothetical protein